MNIAEWQTDKLGQRLNVTGDIGECSQVPISWAMFLYPGVKWQDLFPPVNSAKQMFDKFNDKYFLKIVNNHVDVNQLPMPGDIMVFDATPAKGYSNTYQNPNGHTGVCVSASPSGYTLLQQNSPASNVYDAKGKLIKPGSGCNDTSFPWKYRPCLGWLRPRNLAPTIPVPPTPVTSGNVGKTIHLPAKNADGSPDNSWHLYHEDGPYDYPHAIAVLNPAQFGGLDYQILADKGNGIYAIQTQMFGRGAIWTMNTNATIS